MRLDVSWQNNTAVRLLGSSKMYSIEYLNDHKRYYSFVISNTIEILIEDQVLICIVELLDLV